MPPRSRRAGALLLSACILALASTGAGAAEEPAHPASLDEAIIKSAARHGIPESLVRRVVMRESKYNPRARNHRYWGLMQISYPTAKSMGFKGTPEQLLNPVVNLRYAVPYLANAFIIAGKRQDAAIRLYAAGYYDTAKRRGLLGLLRTADSAPLAGVPDEPDMVATVAPPPPQQDTGIFGALFGPNQMQRDAEPQQVASAEPAPAIVPQATDVAPAAAAGSARLPDGKSSDDVTLVADKHGDLQPPKKWLHDGGTTVIARGEQAVDKVAAFEKGGAASESGRSRHRKVAVFASLDEQPASAQAYAATGSQDPRLMQADSQAAIIQATSGQPQPVARAEAPAAQSTTTATTVAADESKPKSHRRHVARHTRHDDDKDAVAQAPASVAPQQQAAAAPDGQPQQTAAEPQAQPAPETRAVDASGYPVDAGGQTADAGDATPAKRKRHAVRHAHAHKATSVAAAAQDDAKAPPAAQ